jgi:hypothetical protein
MEGYCIFDASVIDRLDGFPDQVKEANATISAIRFWY